jgi:hypothetical protein
LPGKSFIEFDASAGSFFHAQDVLADVGPELFEDVGASGDNGLSGEVLRGLADAALGGGIVEV